MLYTERQKEQQLNYPKEILQIIIVIVFHYDLSQFLWDKPPTLIIYERFDCLKEFSHTVAWNTIRPLQFTAIKCSVLHFLLPVSKED